ncbi:MAG: hypothetical protein M1827_000617 [Pycnora praestabilis]|nr:MAG: hypothetical protein M1827_000617 [Pycnora praestabilis]
MPGKRKRKESQNPETLKVRASSEDDEELEAVFRRHFEARFKPLKERKHKTQPIHHVLGQTDQEENDDDESDWDGLSGNEGEAKVEVVEHAATDSSTVMHPKAELKSFMTPKPPSAGTKTGGTSIPKRIQPPDSEEAATDAANLKKDLALQRLLTESHLLDPTSSLSPLGSNRHKATDLRLLSMGSKASILTQERMPMSHRKGIAAKASEKEETRRREAKENGIILERAKTAKKRDGIRQRGFGAPVVGRFKGGMLRLSKRDVADIEGPKVRVKERRGGKR